MQEITFTNKTFYNTFAAQCSRGEINIPKPMICPICGAFEDGVNIDRKLFSRSKDSRFGTVLYQCTHCQEKYLVNYSIDLSAESASFEGFIPTASVAYTNELLESVSPRFIDAYNQALRAETSSDIELAAIGFRHALECLVKDYAISELKKEKSEVTKKTLNDAIGTYLGEDDLVSTADVVRILGNDYAHYERKYPQHDFELLKKYMVIFTKLIETKLLIAHPPVSR